MGEQTGLSENCEEEGKRPKRACEGGRGVKGGRAGAGRVWQDMLLPGEAVSEVSDAERRGQRGTGRSRWGTERCSFNLTGILQT